MTIHERIYTLRENVVAAVQDRRPVSKRRQAEINRGFGTFFKRLSDGRLRNEVLDEDQPSEPSSDDEP